MKTIYLDTSVINALYNDSDYSELIPKLKKNAKIITSFLNIAELASTKEKCLRSKLLNFIRKILGDDPPLDKPSDFIRKSLSAMV